MIDIQYVSVVLFATFLTIIPVYHHQAYITHLIAASPFTVRNISCLICKKKKLFKTITSDRLSVILGV